MVHKSNILDLNYEVLLKMASFFSFHNYLGVSKHHVLENKICQILGDALSFYLVTKQNNNVALE